MNPAIAPIPANPLVALRVKALCRSLASSREDWRGCTDGDRCSERVGEARKLDSGDEEESGYADGW